MSRLRPAYSRALRGQWVERAAGCSRKSERKEKKRRCDATGGKKRKAQIAARYAESKEIKKNRGTAAFARYICIYGVTEVGGFRERNTGKRKQRGLATRRQLRRVGGTGDASIYSPDDPKLSSELCRNSPDLLVFISSS
ncbi:hypothetical protein MRX96_044452 [Rhipicephalus microplus]